MGKSLTATLLGLLVRDGELALEDPAPVPAWRTPADPRGSIRIADLMRMSSGLQFTSPQDPGYDPASGYPDHLYVYSGAIDAFEFSYNRPLEFPPNTKGRYRNCDPLILGYVIQRIVTGRGEDYLSYPQRALFDRIGIRKQVLETDPYGNFLLTGHDYGTARNWARLGQLYLQGGVWQGERLLPEQWVEFVRSPAPAWDEPVYGGLFWLNGNGKYRLPRDAYFMSGAGGQLTFIIPSLDTVIVRMGYMRGDTPGMRNNLNAALELITRALRSVSTRS
jgi:CubicO group peptidase (beta-lactamase class C family)